MAIVSRAQVRAQGLSSQAAPDAQVDAAILLATDYIHKATGRWFEPVTYTAESPLFLDGTGSDALYLPVPIIRLDGVTEGSQALTLTDLAYPAHDGRNMPDERMRTKLFKKATSAPGVIYGSTGYGRRLSSRWARLRRNVALAGVFGFIDGLYRGAWDNATAYAVGDVVSRSGQHYTAAVAHTGADPATDNTGKWTFGCAPLLIRQTALRLVLREYRLLTDPMDETVHELGKKRSETVAGWSYTLAGLVASGGLTGVPVIDDVLAAYRLRYVGGHTGNYDGRR